MNPAFRDYQERTSKVAEVLQSLRKENEICALKGWRDEVYQRVYVLNKFKICSNIMLLAALIKILS